MNPIIWFMFVCALVVQLIFITFLLHDIRDELRLIRKHLKGEVIKEELKRNLGER